MVLSSDNRTPKETLGGNLLCNILLARFFIVGLLYLFLAISKRINVFFQLPLIKLKLATLNLLNNVILDIILIHSLDTLSFEPTFREWVDGVLPELSSF